MARLPRLALPGHTHLVLQAAHAGLAAAGRPLFRDELDRRTYRTTLFTTAAAEQVGVHAYALCAHEVRLLLTPATAGGLSRLMQALGRGYVSAHHRRHGGRGTLWDGRFRAAVLEPGAWRLAALQWVDAADAEPEPDMAAAPAGSAAGSEVNSADNSAANNTANSTASWAHSSAGPRLSSRPEAGLQDVPEWWSLGNTPFEREAAYRSRLAQGLPAAQAQALRRAALGGWALGSPAFVDQVAQALGRPAAPRPRGRPRRSAGTGKASEAAD